MLEMFIYNLSIENDRAFATFLKVSQSQNVSSIYIPVFGSASLFGNS